MNARNEPVELELGKLEIIDFNAFWNAFPRHKDRARAEAAYARARKIATAAEILEAARAYAASVEGVPAGATRWAVEWLRAEPWRPRTAPKPAPRSRHSGVKPARPPRLSPKAAAERAAWIRDHGLTEAEYEANKHDAEWLARIKERGPRER